MGLAAQGWMMALAVPPQMIASLKGPGLMSVLSDKVAPEQQGVLQGSVMSLRVLSKVTQVCLSQSVSVYGKGRSGRLCCGQRPWHVYLHFTNTQPTTFTGRGRPHLRRRPRLCHERQGACRPRLSLLRVNGFFIVYNY